MTYLSDPENRVRFNYVFEQVQQKKPLRVPGMIPTMTFFLFDTDPYRQRFARAAWTNMTPGSLKKEEWVWAVQSNLAEAIGRVSLARTPAPTIEKIQAFWEGFILIIQALSEHQIIHWLRAMDVTPSVYMLALDHCFRVDGGRRNRRADRRTEDEEAQGIQPRRIARRGSPAEAPRRRRPRRNARRRQRRR